MAAGGWPSTTSGASFPALYQTATNKQNFQFIDFQHCAGDCDIVEYAEWTISVPCNISLTNMTARFIWTANSTSTNSVVWLIQARGYIDNEVLDAAWSTSVSVTDANGSTAYTNRQSGATSTFTPAGYNPNQAGLIQFRVSRDPVNASDTLDVTARLIAVVLNVAQGNCS